MEKPAARGVVAAGSSRLLAAAHKARYAPRFASPSEEEANEHARDGQWAGRPIFASRRNDALLRENAPRNHPGSLSSGRPSESRDAIGRLQRGAAPRSG